MDISIWLAIPGALVASGALIAAGVKGVKWIRERWPEEIDPGVWDVGPGSADEPHCAGTGRRRRPGLAYRASADEVARTLLHLAETWREEDIDELREKAAQNRGDG